MINVNPKTVLAAVAVGLIAGGLVAGCTVAVEGNPQTGATGNLPFSIRPHTVVLPDGRNVLCIWEGTSGQESGGGGVSCDWDRAYYGKPDILIPVVPTNVPAPEGK